MAGMPANWIDEQQSFRRRTERPKVGTGRLPTAEPALVNTDCLVGGRDDRLQGRLMLDLGPLDRVGLEPAGDAEIDDAKARIEIGALDHGHGPANQLPTRGLPPDVLTDEVGA